MRPSCRSSCHSAGGMGCAIIWKFSSTSDTDRGPGITAATVGWPKTNWRAAALSGTPWRSQIALQCLACSKTLAEAGSSLKVAFSVRSEARIPLLYGAPMITLIFFSWQNILAWGKFVIFQKRGQKNRYLLENTFSKLLPFRKD